MGILKISNLLHDEIRTSSKAMSRSINAQAEFWIKLGRLSELNPTLSYQEILREHLLTDSENLRVPQKATNPTQAT